MNLFTGQTCRTCLTVDADFLPLESQLENSTSNNKTLKEALQDITRMEFLDDDTDFQMPQIICCLCCKQLKNSYDFIVKAQKCNDELITMVAKLQEVDCLDEQTIDIPMDEIYNILDITEDNDTFVEDTYVEESFVEESFVEESFVEESFVVDSFVENNFVEEISEDIEMEETILKLESEDARLIEQPTIDESLEPNIPDLENVSGSVESIKTFYSNRTSYITDDSKMQCYFCPHATARRHDLFLHIRKAHKCTIGDLRNEYFATENNNDDIYTTNHGTDEDDFLRILMNFSKKEPSLKESSVKSEVLKHDTMLPPTQTDLKCSNDNVQYKKCQFCANSYAKKHDLFRHLKARHLNDINELKKNDLNFKGTKSDQTGEDDVDEYLYYILNMQKRTKDGEPVKCKYCEFIANNNRAMIYHLRFKHKNHDNQAKCQFCENSYFQKHDLLRHLKSKHKEAVNELKKNDLDFQSSKRARSGDEKDVDDDDDDDYYYYFLNMQKRTKDRKPIPCQYCEYVAKNNRAMIYHLRFEHKNHDNQAKCQFCENSYLKKHDLLRHLKSKHMQNVERLKKEMDFESEKSNLESHDSSTNTITNPAAASAGDDEFFYYLLNMQKRSMILEEPLPCSNCDYVAYTKRAMLFHTRLKHGITNEENQIKCIFCENAYPRKFDLLRHVKSSHMKKLKAMKKDMESTKSFEMDGDNSSSSSKELNDKEDSNGDDFDDNFIYNILNMQRRTSKSAETRSLARSCDICQKVLLGEDGLKNHKRYVHANEEDFYTCKICNNRYRRQKDLRVHMQNKHSTTPQPDKPPAPPLERKYLCSYCSHCFTTITSLNIHVKRMHTGERPFKCNQCDKAFLTSFDLKSHTYTHTGERPYKCPFCQKCFRLSSDLRKHKRIHTNERPYKCSLCDKRFTQSYNVTIHKRTHHKSLNFSCNVCGKIFNNGTLLNLHRISEEHLEEVE